MSTRLMVSWYFTTGVVVALAVSACGVGGMLADSQPAAPPTGPSGGQVGHTVNDDGNFVFDDTQPVIEMPRAVCGPGSNPETGIQGQVPRADRVSDRSLEGYWCNLELLGHEPAEGGTWSFAWYDDCAYFSTLPSPNRQMDQGAVVIDGSNPATPVISALLTTPAVMDPHESLKVNEKRALLGALNLGPNYDNGTGTGDFDVYDVSGDCTHPKLLATVNMASEGVNGHEGEFMRDGRTYFGTEPGNAQNQTTRGTIMAFDLEDPSKPEVLFQALVNQIHGLTFNADGTRAYVSNLQQDEGPGTGPAGNGVDIYDVSEIQQRKPNPSIRRLTQVRWAHDACAQNSIYIISGGKPYLVHFSECGYGAARILDISDELNPFIASMLQLEVHLLQNREIAASDGAAGILQYDGHYCNVDRYVEPTVVACAMSWSGIRVFDIRDVTQPKEIAYFIPPGMAAPPAGSSASFGAGGGVDSCSAQLRLVPERGELWTMCQGGGFFALKFTNGVWPFQP